MARANRDAILVRPTQDHASFSKGYNDMPLVSRIEQSGQRSFLRLMAVIRGVLALEVLQKIEDTLRPKAKGEKFKLTDYFDYIAGTSTGGIIAAGLSIGMSVSEILDFYQKSGAQMFVRTSLLKRLRYKFNAEPLALKLKQVFGAGTASTAETRGVVSRKHPIHRRIYEQTAAPDRSDCGRTREPKRIFPATTSAGTTASTVRVVGTVGGFSARLFVCMSALSVAFIAGERPRQVSSPLEDGKGQHGVDGARGGGDDAVQELLHCGKSDLLNLR